MERELHCLTKKCISNDRTINKLYNRKTERITNQLSTYSIKAFSERSTELPSQTNYLHITSTTNSQTANSYYPRDK